jgi:hypothetical protein
MCAVFGEEGMDLGPCYSAGRVVVRVLRVVLPWTVEWAFGAGGVPSGGL